MFPHGVSVPLSSILWQDFGESNLLWNCGMNTTSHPHLYHAISTVMTFRKISSSEPKKDRQACVPQWIRSPLGETGYVTLHPGLGIWFLAPFGLEIAFVYAHPHAGNVEVPLTCDLPLPPFCNVWLRWSSALLCRDLHTCPEGCEFKSRGQQINLTTVRSVSEALTLNCYRDAEWACSLLLTRTPLCTKCSAK